MLATELTQEQVEKLKAKTRRYKRAVAIERDKVYPICPMPKPRMTQRDTWKHRACVDRYHAFKDHVALEKLTFDECYSHIVFVMPMPTSWSDGKKERMLHTPHKQQSADIDNLCKAIMDAVYDQDGCVWDIRISKIWGYAGAIVVSQGIPWPPGGNMAFKLVSQAFIKGE